MELLMTAREVGAATQKFFESYLPLGDGTLELLYGDIDIEMVGDEVRTGDPGSWMNWLTVLWAQRALVVSGTADKALLTVRDRHGNEAVATVRSLHPTQFAHLGDDFDVSTSEGGATIFSEPAAFTLMASFVSSWYSVPGISLDGLIAALDDARIGVGPHADRWNGLLS